MIDESSIIALRDSVKSVLSGHRFEHVLGVEEAAAYIGKFCLPDKLFELRVAALLHDITKELSDSEHLQILKENSFFPSDDLINNPHLLHSFSAPFAVIKQYPSFADREILSAVEKHTLGADDMTVFDEIIFISDYVEEGRIYDSCITTRNFLYGGFKDGEIESNRLALHRACIMSIDYTVQALQAKDKFVHPRVLDAKKALSALINQ